MLAFTSCARRDQPRQIVSQQSPKTLAQLLALSPSDNQRNDIALINLLCAEGLPGTEHLNVSDNLATLDTWAERIQSETDRNLYRYRANPRDFENSEAYFRMLIMAAVVYDDCRVRYNPDRISAPGEADSGEQFFADSADIFLHGLLGPRRMGTCSSMPVLYIALGRRLGYPLKLVATKSHLFIRWEGDAERFNLEATGRGMNKYDDAHFRKWPFPVSDEEIKTDGYLKSMTPSEELACFLSLRGHCLIANGRLPEAVAAYAHAAHLAPATRAYQALLADAQNRQYPVQNRPVTLPRAAVPATAGPPDPNPILGIR
jgi:hypothetical protein